MSQYGQKPGFETLHGVIAIPILKRSIAGFLDQVLCFIMIPAKPERYTIRTLAEVF
jgi:hypothetical protein